jgi:hypothetical protein
MAGRWAYAFQPLPRRIPAPTPSDSCPEPPPFRIKPDPFRLQPRPADPFRLQPRPAAPAAPAAIEPLKEVNVVDWEC